MACYRRSLSRGQIRFDIIATVVFKQRKPAVFERAMKRSKENSDRKLRAYKQTTNHRHQTVEESYDSANTEATSILRQTDRSCSISPPILSKPSHHARRAIGIEDSASRCLDAGCGHCYVIFKDKGGTGVGSAGQTEKR